MRAVILAAGTGERLGRRVAERPKVLLEIGGRTLLERHLRLLRIAGIGDVAIGVGYGAEHVHAALARIGATERVATVHNPDFRRGSVVTFWTLREALTRGGDVLVMDGDVLYDRRMLQRLIATHQRNCFLLDREVEPGEEPMKLAIRDGVPVDFRKVFERPHDYYGESVGFFRFSAETAADVVEAAAALIGAGHDDAYFEEALRAVLLASPPDRFGLEDVTGLPWIEIDFPADVERAEREILPALLPEDR